MRALLLAVVLTLTGCETIDEARAARAEADCMRRPRCAAALRYYACQEQRDTCLRAACPHCGGFVTRDSDCWFHCRDHHPECGPRCVDADGEAQD